MTLEGIRWVLGPYNRQETLISADGRCLACVEDIGHDDEWRWRVYGEDGELGDKDDPDYLGRGRVPTPAAGRACVLAVLAELGDAGVRAHRWAYTDAAWAALPPEDGNP
jgi:hypothetical protein